jgi:integrase
MGSIKPRTIKRSDGSQYQILRAQYHHPHGPGDRPRNYEQTFNADAPKYRALKTKTGKLFTKRQRESAAMDDAREFVGNEAKIADGTWVDPDASPVEPEDEDDAGITTREVVNEWRAEWDLAPKTRASYESILEPAVVKDDAKRAKPTTMYICGRWGDQPIANITRDDIAAWVKELRAKYAAQTTHNAYNVARGLMTFAVTKGYIESRDNPTGRETGIKLPRKADSHREMLFCEMDELHALVAATTPWWRPAVWIDGLLGMRAGELWAITHADVDLDNGVLDITKAIKDVGGKLIIGPTKTHARRKIDIPDTCVDDFRDLLARPGVYLRGVRGPNARADSEPIRGYAAVVDGALGGVEDEDDPRRLLFVTDDPRPGRPVSEANFLKRELRPAVRRAVEAGAMSKAKFMGQTINRKTREPITDALLRTHDLRHSAATHALDVLGNTDAALFDVMQMLGHSSIDTTTRLYGHRTKAGGRKLAAAISASADVNKRSKSPANSGKRSGKI